MSTFDDLIGLLKKLRLSGVLQTLELRTRQASEDNLGHTEFLYRLLSDEAERRDGKQLDQRLLRASFESEKTLEEFDFLFNPEIPKAKIIDLATCTFVERRENVLLIGPTGTGKSHLAQALGHRACRAGFQVLYLAAQDLLKQLRAARADGSHDKRMLRFTAPQLLIIDDLGLRPLSGDEAIDLYEIIRLRYERAATILTSNRAVDELPALFGDALLASAAMDRLLHGAHVLELEGETYRNPRSERSRSRKNGQKANKEQKEGNPS
jgi:DNA replication protein DnaC